jgi:hydrogenase expression/formation protein HypE
LGEGERVLLGHGSGGRLTADLIARHFLPAFRNPYLERLDDQAVLDVGGTRLAFTTDSYVVSPLFFPGGDIGTLAVNGTVNDLAMAGARPLYLSAGFILEEGFALADLGRIVDSMSTAAKAAGVLLVTGDTKVVDRGKADGCFINTAGLGIVSHTLDISVSGARPGDLVILSGPIAEHGMTIMATRAELELEAPIASDTGPLHELVLNMLDTGGEIHCLRDPTRGGVATALNEIARQSGVGIVIEEAAIIVREPVRGVCELLGLDPLYVANEGKLVAVVAAGHAERVLACLVKHATGREARIIGEVVSDPDRLVVLKTRVGGRRIVDTLQGDQLPRIC